MTNMLTKTQELAIKLARQNNVNHDGQTAIKSLIEAAFEAYANAWKGSHSLRETKSQWEYFYNILKTFEGKSDLSNLADFQKQAEFSYAWDALYWVVIQIMQGRL